MSFSYVYVLLSPEWLHLPKCISTATYCQRHGVTKPCSLMEMKLQLLCGPSTSGLTPNPSPADLPAGGHTHKCAMWIPGTQAQSQAISRAALTPRPPQLLAHNSSCMHLHFPPKTSPSLCWRVGIHPPWSTRTEGVLDHNNLIFHHLSSVGTLSTQQASCIWFPVWESVFEKDTRRE